MDSMVKKRRRLLLESLLGENGVEDALNKHNAADNDNDSNSSYKENIPAAVQAGRLEELKQREAELSTLLAEVRREKLAALRSRPLTIGIVGFGRFGQFIAKTFAKYGRVVATSRTDYSDVSSRMGVTYVPLSNAEAFLDENLDVIVLTVSILSFRSTLAYLAPVIAKHLEHRKHQHIKYGQANKNGNGNAVPVVGPLIVDDLSVKEYARKTMLELLPPECDILCTHPMFGPESGKNGWMNLNFVYEKTRIDRIILDPVQPKHNPSSFNNTNGMEVFVEEGSGGRVHSVHEDCEAHMEGMDRMERFLSIWEEEGCRMVPMSCREHDAHAAKSQFITHLIGRVLGSQGLVQTPIDTSGFQSVLKLVDSTNADSFDLFYGLYKYNQNSMDTITKLQSAMNHVVNKLHQKEQEEQAKRDNQEEEKQMQLVEQHQKHLL